MKKNKNINLPVFMRNSNTESVGQYVCLCISCWLITMGLSLLVDVQFEFENGLPVLLLQTFIITALLSAIAFSRWLIIPYIAAVFITFAAMMLFGGDGNFFVVLKLFIEWCSLGMPEDHYWYSTDNVNIVHFFENLGICALVYFLACTSQKSKLCSMLCFGTIIAIYAFGYIEYQKIAIFFLFVGLFLLYGLYGGALRLRRRGLLHGIAARTRALLAGLFMIFLGLIQGLFVVSHNGFLSLN